MSLSKEMQQIVQLIDKLNDYQQNALRVFLESLLNSEKETGITEELLTEIEAKTVHTGFQEISEGKGESWENVKRELGI